MPQYEKITAKSFREARQMAFQKYGLDISIVKETRKESKNWKKFWFSKDDLCEIVVAKYKNKQELPNAPAYKGTFDQLEEKTSSDDGNPKKKLQDFSKVLEKKHHLINSKLKTLSAEKASWEQSIERFRAEKDFSPNSENLLVNELQKTSFDEKLLKKPSQPVMKKNVFFEQKKLTNSVENFLKEQRFGDDLVKKLIKNYPKRDLNSQESFEHLAGMVASHFSFSQDFFSQKEKRFFFFLGSPGVGKTTTFFKVAVDLVKVKNRDVFLSCYDQKRLMGTAQVEKFSDILQVPFSRIESSACLRRLKKECTPSTTFLVDLGGISPLGEQFNEYENLLNSVEKNRKTILVVNASMGGEEIDFCIKKFASFFAIDGLVLSHIDEVRSLGPVLSAVDSANLPIVLLCYGQDIPHDMSFATQKNLEERLFHFFAQNTSELR